MAIIVTNGYGTIVTTGTPDGTKFLRDDLAWVTPAAGLTSPVAIADGGTGATSASAARTALGLEIGTNVQEFDSDLSTLAGLTATTGNIIVSAASAWTSATPDTAGLVAKTGTQTGIAGAKTWTGAQTIDLGAVSNTILTQWLRNSVNAIIARIDDQPGGEFFFYNGGTIGAAISVARGFRINSNQIFTRFTGSDPSGGYHQRLLTSGNSAVGIVTHTAVSTLGTFFIGGRSSTTFDVTAFEIIPTWVDATHASRKARAVFGIYDTATREAMRFEASGTAAMIGFLGAAAVAQQAIGAAATDLATVITLANNIRTALINLGLCKT